MIQKLKTIMPGKYHSSGKILYQESQTEKIPLFLLCLGVGIDSVGVVGTVVFIWLLYERHKSQDDKVRQRGISQETQAENKNMTDSGNTDNGYCEEDNLRYLSSVSPFSNDSARDLGECF